MPLFRILTALSLGASPALALPGEKLPDQFPDLSAQALVTSAVTTSDGSTFLMGNFTQADGITRPGLAKLTPSGYLDHTFAPPSFSLTDYQTNPPIFIFSLSPHTREPLFPLQRGGLIITSPLKWELRNPDGTLNDTLLPQFPRESDAPPIPQFETDNKLLVISRGEGIEKFAHVISLQSDTLLPNQNFTLAAELPSPPFQASPATDGKIWILGRDYYPDAVTSNPYVPPHILYRLLPDGSLDPSFTPETLNTQHNYSLIPNSGPGLQSASNWPGRYQYSPPAQYDSITFETRDSEGIVTQSRSASFDFGLSPFYHLLEDGSLLAQTVGFDDLVIHDPLLNETSLRIQFETPQGPPETRTVTQFPDGRFLVGGNRRFLTDGTADPNWHTTRLSRQATITHLIPLRDNSILAVGDFDLANGLPRSGAVELNQDTTFDSSFHPNHDLRNARSIHQKQNGNFIVHLNKPYEKNVLPRTSLIELDPQGTFIRTIDLPGRSDQSNISSIALLSDDSLLIFLFYQGEVPRSELIRIQPNGTSTTHPISLIPSITLSHPLIIFPDDRLLIARNLHAADGTLLAQSLPENTRPLTLLPDGSLLVEDFTQSPMLTFRKWHPDHGLDPTFNPQAIPNTIQAYFFNATPIANQKLLLDSNTFFETTTQTKLRRFHSSIQEDPSFQLTYEQAVGPLFYYATPPVILSLQTPNGPAFWLAGNLAKINGQPASSLNVIEDSTAPDFHAWMHASAQYHQAASSDLLPNADPDKDGATNLFEYAASTDPFLHSPTHNTPRKTGPLTFQIPCNPEAPGIIRQIQSSPDLINWAPATANQVRLETSSSCLTWTLLDNSHRQYTRLRVLSPE